ncbi:MAG: zinc-binding alcohol dehydrogenase [Planctomycetota bacterium]|nr:zinc-binding alcohol dehydrogenase [Planctomycetota bacterium]
MPARIMTLGYWIERAGHGALRAVDLPPLGPGAVAVDAICTGVSPGTERLVGLARVPASLHAEMACRGMQGSFELPLLYGYSFVGRVASGADRGRRAFLMRPHQQRAVAPSDELVWLPDEVPDARATLFPNLETARNAVWDAELSGDDRAVVIGAGPVGLLCAFVLARDLGRPAALVVDRDPERRSFAAALPWVRDVAAPEQVEPGAFTHALHASASGAGLQLALDAVGFEGLVVELSWHGDQAVSLQLGGAFHSQRKRLHASQVGAVARARRAEGHAARTRAVLSLLCDDDLDRLIGPPTPFLDAPETFAALYQSELDALCPHFAYE